VQPPPGSEAQFRISSLRLLPKLLAQIS
jgi:hypothetical protein